MLRLKIQKKLLALSKWYSVIASEAQDKEGLWALTNTQKRSLISQIKCGNMWHAIHSFLDHCLHVWRQELEIFYFPCIPFAKSIFDGEKFATLIEKIINYQETRYCTLPNVTYCVKTETIKCFQQKRTHCFSAKLNSAKLITIIFSGHSDSF